MFGTCRDRTWHGILADRRTIINVYDETIVLRLHSSVLKEEIMFQVTEKANEMIREFQKDKDKIPPIRLKLLPSSCGTPTLRMTLDEPQENDETFHDRGLTFLMDKQLFEQVKPVKIDYVHAPAGDGFSISANLSKAVSSGTSYDTTGSGSCV
jgi:Fe-S cluster assembly iron-binding protein IscA